MGERDWYQTRAAMFVDSTALMRVILLPLMRGVLIRVVVSRHAGRN